MSKSNTIIDALNRIEALAETLRTAAAQPDNNALSMAGWHVARGEPEKALARLRRAHAHIRHGMEGAAA